MNETRFFTTTKYDDFVLILGNRPINEPHVRKLMKDYEQDGEFIDEIHVNPTKVNGKWAVVDGQHRFTACRRMGVPVNVIIKRKDVELDEIQRINKLRKNWNLEDLIRSYAALGNEDYQRLLAVWEDLNAEYGIAPITVAYIAQGNLTNTQRKDSKNNVKEGNWKFVVPETEVRRVIRECAKFREVDDRCMTAIFITCIHRLLDTDPLFSVDRLLRQAQTFPWKFIRASRKVDMLRMIDELYNFRKKEDNRHRIDINL